MTSVAVKMTLQPWSQRRPTERCGEDVGPACGKGESGNEKSAGVAQAHCSAVWQVDFNRVADDFDVVTWCADHEVMAGGAAVKNCCGVTWDNFMKVRETSRTM